MKRRDFLKTSALAAAATTGLLNPFQASAAVADKPVVKRWQTLGKTGLKMSDIAYGCSQLPSPSMMLRAIERGINYFDTAPDYGDSEKTIGEAMSKVQRDKIILATKFCKGFVYPDHLSHTSKKKDYIEALDGSLKRLKTDYVDIAFVHAIGEDGRNRQDEEKRLNNDELFGAVEELKKAGKMRYLAISSHGPNNPVELLTAAIKSGHYDIIMPAFNFMKNTEFDGVLTEAKNKGVGVVAMKTLAGAKEKKLDKLPRPFEPAALKWVLKHQEIAGLIITITTLTDLDLYLTASGETFSSLDQELLDQYAKQYSSVYCRTGCNQCQGGCSFAVPIATIMRYQMYFEDYGQEKRAMQAYARLTANAQRCAQCSGGCAGACPYGLSIQAMMNRAHESLGFNA
jgi:hypothetical protein